MDICWMNVLWSVTREIVLSNLFHLPQIKKKMGRVRVSVLCFSDFYNSPLCQPLYCLLFCCYYFLNLKIHSRGSALFTWKQEKISRGVKQYLHFITPRRPTEITFQNCGKSFHFVCLFTCLFVYLSAYLTLSYRRPGAPPFPILYHLQAWKYL